MRRVFGVARLLVAALGAVALVFDFDYVLGFSTFSTINYFSYFTFQSNLVNMVVLATSGVLLLRGHTVGRFLVSIRGMFTTYVMVSGIVFGLIVSQAGSHSYRIEVPWSSVVLHFVIPTFVLVDWVLGVGRVRLRWRTALIVLAFPIVWGVFTLIRGADVGWYPYFFLDPGQVTPIEFTFYCGLAIALFAGIMAGLVALSRRRPLLSLGAARPGRRRAGPVARVRAALSGSGSASATPTGPEGIRRRRERES